MVDPAGGRTDRTAMETRRAGAPQIRISAWLRAQCEQEWNAAHRDHQFVKAIGEGTLPLPKFQFFMCQDYLFLIEYCRVLGIAAAKSPDVETMSSWAKLLDETLNAEMELHRSFCADFGITRRQLANTNPAQGTISYTSHLLRCAYEGDMAVIAASILPCQWGYDEIGRRLARSLRAPEKSFHARWVAGYNTPEYQRMTLWLRRLVDRLGADAGQESRQRMLDVFSVSTRHERSFWDQAWSSQAHPD